MAALTCDICGGKLIGKPGGLFECEYCGVQYDTAWAKEKIQEIKGTVKVEGTVEVTGSVKIDGPVKVEGRPNAESLLKRAAIALEDEDWETAETVYQDVLNINAKCAEAYFGLAMCSAEVSTLKALVNYNEWEDKNYCRGKQFADKALRTQVKRLEEEYLQDREEDWHRSREAALAAREAELNRLKTGRDKAQKYQGLISAGAAHSVALNANGTVTATKFTGSRSFYAGGCAVSDWRDIVAVSAGKYHTLGLKADGTVVSTPYTGRYKNYYGQCEVSGWRDIVAVSAGAKHTVGLKADGTVVAIGDNTWCQCKVSEWRNIVAVSAGDHHTVALEADGSVRRDGSGFDGECDVAGWGWKDLVDISAGYYHTVGLKANGTVIATKFRGNMNIYRGQCEVSDWRNIRAVSAGDRHTVGLKADGTVVAVGDNTFGQCEVSDWRDIVAVSAGDDYTLGLKSDGTVLAAGVNHCGQCEVREWKLFRKLATLEEEYREEPLALKQWEEEERRQKEEQRPKWRSDGLCQHCGGQLKGLFGKKCTVCGKPKDY